VVPAFTLEVREGTEEGDDHSETDNPKRAVKRKEEHGVAGVVPGYVQGNMVARLRFNPTHRNSIMGLHLQMTKFFRQRRFCSKVLRGCQPKSAHLPGRTAALP